MSVLLWGPPGTGKTTIASIVSGQTGRHFVEVSAVSAGVKEVRAAIDQARARLARSGTRDRAVHRRGAPVQQGAAGRPAARGGEPLGHADRGDHREPAVLGDLPAAVPVPAAAPGVACPSTTSGRCCARHSRTSAATRARSTLEEEALEHLVRLAGGDARRAYTYLEAAAAAAESTGSDLDRPGGGRGRGRPGGRPLRPRGRPALRRDQRLHQVGARQRRQRRAALPGPDDRGGGGPAVHREAADHPGQRGHRTGRPERADDGGGGGPGGGADRDARRGS